MYQNENKLFSNNIFANWQIPIRLIDLNAPNSDHIIRIMNDEHTMEVNYVEMKCQSVPIQPNY